MSTIVKCRAKDPANCSYPGHKSLHAPVQSHIKDMRQFFGEALPSPKTISSLSHKPASLTQHAAKTSLTWKGDKPSWWNKFYEESASNPHLPSQPELLDVIDSPAGKLAVVWQPESQDKADDGMTITSGIGVSACYYKSIETGRTLGYIKMASMTEETVEKAFGNDEFTPYRWSSRFSGSNFGFRAKASLMQPYGERDLTGDELIQKRREVWVHAQQNLGAGLKTEDGGYVSSINVTQKNLPDDATVQKDLKKFARVINKQIKFKKEYYKTPYVDFSRVEEPLKGKGFGSALYVYTARRLAQNDQVLRGSGIQSDDAMRTWENFRKNLKGKVSSIELNYNGDKSISPVLDFRIK